MAKRMLAKVLDEHNEKADEFIRTWKKERKDHGDKGDSTGKIDFEKLRDFGRTL